MDKGLIPRRYAKALLEVAQDKGLAAEIYSLMQALCRAFDAEPALQTTLANPFVSDADKEALLLAATGDAGAAKDLFSDYLALLARNGRLDIARGVALSYIDQYRGENDIYSVEVESAAALSDESRQRIKELHTFEGMGRKRVSEVSSGDICALVGPVTSGHGLKKA